MRLTFVFTSPRFSGGRQELLRLAEELQRRGHEVDVRILGEKATLLWATVTVPAAGLGDRDWHRLPPCDALLFDRPKLAGPLLRANRGLTVHVCQGFEGTDKANRLAALTGLRLWRHGWRLRRRIRQIDAAYSLPTVKIATHRHLQDLIATRFGQRAWLVPLGLPEGLFTPPPTRSFAGRTVLIVGPADVRCKRLPDALEAVRRLKARLAGVRLLRAAQHPMRPAELALGVTDEYHTMIPPTAMAELYRRADVLLMSSDSTEGFGLPALEAMACGTPAVLTDIPAFRTFASPCDYAHFAPVGCPDQLAEALERLLNDEAERRRLSRRGPEVAGEYTSRRSFDAWEQTLQRIAGESAAAKRPA